MPVTNLKRVQLGQEVTWGTSVAATALLMGVTASSLQIADEIYRTEEQGHLAPSNLREEVKQWAEASLDYDLSYEDILFLLDGIHGDCTPTGTDPYTWAYAAPNSTALTPREYTVEYGMASGEYEMAGAIFNDFTISSDVDGDGIWQASCNLIGKKVAAEAMASLSRRSSWNIRIADTVLTIDTQAGTIGTTTVAGALISFELAVDPKYHLKWFNGSVNPANFGHDRWEGQLTLVLEFTADVKAHVDALLAPAVVPKQIRLKATSGTRTAQIDFAGHLVDGVPLYEDRDGNVTVQLVFDGAYNSTLGNWLKFEIVNAVASLP